MEGRAEPLLEIVSPQVYEVNYLSGYGWVKMKIID